MVSQNAAGNEWYFSPLNSYLIYGPYPDRDGAEKCREQYEAFVTSATGCSVRYSDEKIFDEDPDSVRV